MGRRPPEVLHADLTDARCREQTRDRRTDPAGTPHLDVRLPPGCQRVVGFVRPARFCRAVRRTEQAAAGPVRSEGIAGISQADAITVDQYACAVENLHQPICGCGAAADALGRRSERGDVPDTVHGPEYGDLGRPESRQHHSPGRIEADLNGGRVAPHQGQRRMNEGAHGGPPRRFPSGPGTAESCPLRLRAGLRRPQPTTRSTDVVAARGGIQLWTPPLTVCGGAQAFPRIRLRFVEQTGQVAFAIRVPLSLTTTLPLASRLALHFTQ
jgi:hypothetical protein